MSGPGLDAQPFVPSNSGGPNPLPAGEAFQADPDKWYYLKARYTDDDGNPAEGYAYPLGKNASESFWDNVVFSKGGPGNSALRFKLHTPDDQGWSRWDIHDDDYNDGYYLSCRATGWLYRATGYDVKFRIVSGKMYCNYRWNGPVGSEYRHILVSPGRYLGMDLPDFTCELEAAS